MRYHYIISITFLVFSCETKWGKYGGYKMEYDNEFEYYIILDKIDTSLDNYKYFNKGAFIKYFRNNGSIDTVFVGNEGQVIGPYINSDNVCFDSTFILLAQKPLDKIFGGIVQKPNPHWKIEPSKEVLEKSNLYQYWIINKISNSIYGPLNRKEYLRKRKELAIPIKLEIKLPLR